MAFGVADRVRRLEERVAILAGLVQHVVQQQAVAGAGQAPPSGPDIGVTASVAVIIAHIVAGAVASADLAGVPLVGAAMTFPLATATSLWLCRW